MSGEESNEGDMVAVAEVITEDPEDPMQFRVIAVGKGHHFEGNSTDDAKGWITENAPDGVGRVAIIRVSDIYDVRVQTERQVTLEKPQRSDD